MGASPSKSKARQTAHIAELNAANRSVPPRALRLELEKSRIFVQESDRRVFAGATLFENRIASVRLTSKCASLCLELLEKVEPLLTDCPLADIDGGPVQLTHGALLHVLAQLCAENPATSVLIEFPNETIEPNRCWSDFDQLEVRHIGTKWHFCFWTPHWWYGVTEREELESNELAASLGTLPDVTRIEIAFVVEGLAEKCHRYAGVYSISASRLSRLIAGKCRYPERRTGPGHPNI